MSIIQKILGTLGGVLNLFPLGGTNGGIIVRQKGGTPGTNEGTIQTDGNRTYIGASNGTLRLTNSAMPLTSNNYVDLAFGAGGLLIYGSGNNTIGLSENGLMSLCLNYGFAWSNTTNNANATKDSSFGRISASVLGIGTGVASGLVTGKGWIQNTAGEAALANSFTNATANLNNTNLSLTVIAGRSYRITGILQASNSTSTEGVQLDFNGGNATATTFFVAANAIGSVTPGTLTSTSLAGVINYSVITGTDYIVLNGYLKCANAGTFILRFAENTTGLGTATMGAGSWVSLNDTINL